MSENNESGMAEKLENAGKLAEEQKAQRRERAVKGSHLLAAHLELAKRDGLTVQDKTGFHRIVGVATGKAVYVAKKGGRIDLSGFTIDHSAVSQLTAEEAKDRHLGKVRGQLDFNQSDEDVTAAYLLALEELLVPPPAPAPKAEKKIEEPTETAPQAGETKIEEPTEAAAPAKAKKAKKGKKAEATDAEETPATEIGNGPTA